MYYVISESPSDYIQTKILFDSSRIFIIVILIYLSQEFHPNLILLIYYTTSKNQADLVYFMIPIVLSLIMKSYLRKGIKCNLILKYLARYQCSIFLFWPVEASIFFSVYWFYTKSLDLIIIESPCILFALLFEVYYLILIRKMIKLEETGEFYSLENLGKQLPQAQVVINHMSTTQIMETSYAKEVIALPIEKVQLEKSNVLPRNTEFEINDFSHK